MLLGWRTAALMRQRLVGALLNPAQWSPSPLV